MGININQIIEYYYGLKKNSRKDELQFQFFQLNQQTL